MWCNLSVIFNEFVLSYNFSFEPQHYLEDSYIPIIALIPPATVVIAAIEMQSSQQVLQMTFFITEIIEGTLIDILMAYSL